MWETSCALGAVEGEIFGRCRDKDRRVNRFRGASFEPFRSCANGPQFSVESTDGTLLTEDRQRKWW